MISTEASWWNILNWRTTLGYIVSLILLNLGHVFRFRFSLAADDAKAKHVFQVQENSETL